MEQPKQSRLNDEKLSPNASPAQRKRWVSNKVWKTFEKSFEEIIENAFSQILWLPNKVEDIHLLNGNSFVIPLDGSNAILVSVAVYEINELQLELSYRWRVSCCIVNKFSKEVVKSHFLTRKRRRAIVNVSGGLAAGLGDGVMGLSYNWKGSFLVGEKLINNDDLAVITAMRFKAVDKVEPEALKDFGPEPEEIPPPKKKRTRKPRTQNEP